MRESQNASSLIAQVDPTSRLTSSALRLCIPPMEQRSCLRDSKRYKFADVWGLCGRQFHYPVVAGVGDIDVAGGVDRHAVGAAEVGERQRLGGAGPGRQFQHPVVAVVADIEVARAARPLGRPNHGRELLPQQSGPEAVTNMIKL